MSTETTSHHSVLGESWVIPSTPSPKKKAHGDPTPTPAPAPAHTPKSKTHISKGAKATNPSESLTASWASGPELVMPSICETPTEGSWVEYVRTPKQPGSESTRKRRKVSSPSKPQRAQTKDTDAGSSVSDVSKPTSRILGINTALTRTAINAVLIALILHLLGLPELVQQAPSLCQIPTIKSLYTSSCTISQPYPHPYPYSNPNQPTPLTTTQTNLQSILTTTLTTLTPLSSRLKESSNLLNKLSTHLKTSIPAAHHALDLEFTGIENSLTTAILEYDSLRTDLRSALESLLASTHSSVEIHQRRRTEYLERLRTQIRSKAESLNTRFNSLDDHLEAVSIVARDHSQVASVLDSLPFGYFRSSHDSWPETLALLSGAVAHHRPVADSVLSLSRLLGST